jgi:LysM repeat protein
VAAPAAAMAGLAAAFAFGNAHAASAATADAAGQHHSAATAATSQPGVSAALLMAITGQSAADLPVIQLDATAWAAIEPKGKHHRTLPAKYVVKPGDTLASIAKHLYFNSDYWTVLYWANHSQIKYANAINAGQVLSVPAKPSKIPSGPEALAASPAPTGYSSASTPTTTTAPAQTESSSTGTGSSFQACVIAAESGGNAQVMSAGGYYGLYQFSAATWAAYGGNPADWGHASVAEQNQVFENAIAAGGASNWAPYDGC